VNLPPHKIRRFLLPHEVSKNNDSGMVSQSITLVPNIVKSLNCYKIERNINTHTNGVISQAFCFYLRKEKQSKNQTIVRKQNILDLNC
jgi:hypothetical protein